MGVTCMENQILTMIKAFVSGEMGIGQFMIHFQESPDIGACLDSIIANMEENHIPPRRRIITMKGVAQDKPFSPRSEVEQFIKKYAQTFLDLSDDWKENPPKVSEYLRKKSPLTSHGAFKIHSIVADIYYQIDSSLTKTDYYEEQYAFCLDVLPGYLCGGITAENYVSQYILPKYPPTMKKSERKRLIQEEIKQTFQRDCKGYPRWIQMPDWPMGADGKPMVYTGQKNFEHHSEYRFRDRKFIRLHSLGKTCARSENSGRYFMPPHPAYFQ